MTKARGEHPCNTLPTWCHSSTALVRRCSGQRFPVRVDSFRTCRGPIAEPKVEQFLPSGDRPGLDPPVALEISCRSPSSGNRFRRETQLRLGKGATRSRGFRARCTERVPSSENGRQSLSCSLLQILKLTQRLRRTWTPSLSRCSPRRRQEAQVRATGDVLLAVPRHSRLRVERIATVRAQNPIILIERGLHHASGESFPITARLLLLTVPLDLFSNTAAKSPHSRPDSRSSANSDVSMRP